MMAYLHHYSASANGTSGATVQVRSTDLPELATAPRRLL